MQVGGGSWQGQHQSQGQVGGNSDQSQSQGQIQIGDGSWQGQHQVKISFIQVLKFTYKEFMVV